MDSVLLALSRNKDTWTIRYHVHASLDTMPSVTVLLVLLVSAAAFTGVVFYSQPNVPDPQLLVPLAGRTTANVQMDGVSRACSRGDETCKVTGNSDASPSDPDQIVLLRDLPGVPNGKEVAKLRTGCGLTHLVNGNGEVVISTAIGAGTGIAITPGCGDGDPVVLSADLSDVTANLDVEYISDNYLTDKCGFTHAYNAMTNSIESGILIEGSGGILVGACPDGGAQQLSLNGTAIVETLDIEYLSDIKLLDSCGVEFSYDAMQDAVVTTIKVVPADVVVTVDCTPGGEIAVGVNTTALVDVFDVQYFSDQIVTDGCGMTHGVVGPPGDLQIEFNANLAPGTAITIGGCTPNNPVTIGVDGNALFSNFFSSDGCGIDQVFSGGMILNRLDLQNSDGYITVGLCVDGAPVTIDLALLDTAIGGTGFSTAPSGVLLYGNVGAWDQLAPGTAGDILTMFGGFPAWVAPVAYVTDVTATGPLSSTGGTTPDISLSGIISVTNGGTGFSTAPLGTILYGDGTQWQQLGPGTAGQFLSIMAGLPAWVSSAASVTAVTASGPLASSGGATPDISLSGVITFANGGTGFSTAPLGVILYGDGTQWQQLSPGTAGQFLSISAGIPSWVSSAASVTAVTASAPLASSGGATPDISLTGTVSTGNGGTGFSTAPSGVLLYGNAGSWGQLPAGAAGQFLSMVGSFPAWVSSAASVTTVTASAPLASSGGATPDISLSGIVATANGGTGVGTAATGDSLYGSAGNWAVRTIGSAGQVYTVSGGVPVWATLPVSVTSVGAASPLASSGGTNPVISIGSTIPASLGGTGISVVTAGALLYGSGGVWLQRAPGSAGQVLTMSGGLPIWAAPVATGVTSVGATAPLASTGGATPVISIGSAIGTSLGGTGFSVANPGALLYGSGGIWNQRAAGTAGQVLTMSGGLPVWANYIQTPPSTFTVFVDNSGNNANDGLTIGTAVQTLARALAILNENTATEGIISLGVGDTFNLGTDQTYEFFPAAYHYSDITVRGGRVNAVAGTITAVNTAAHGPSNQWHRLTTSITTSPNNYSEYFIENTRTRTIYAVKSNSGFTVDIIGGQTSITDTTLGRPFEIGDGFTIYRISTTLTWANRVSIEQPVGLLYFQDVIIAGGGASDTWHNPPVQPLTVVFTGCRIVSSSTTLPTMYGSMRLEGVASIGIGANTRDVAVHAARAGDEVEFSSVYMKWTTVGFGDDASVIDLYGIELSVHISLRGSNGVIRGVEIANCNSNTVWQMTPTGVFYMEYIRIAMTIEPNYFTAIAPGAVWSGINLEGASAGWILVPEISVNFGGAYERPNIANLLGIQVSGSKVHIQSPTITILNRGSGGNPARGTGIAIRASYTADVFVFGVTSLTAPSSIYSVVEGARVFARTDNPSGATIWTLPLDTAGQQPAPDNIVAVNAERGGTFQMEIPGADIANINLGSNNPVTVFRASHRSQLHIYQGARITYSGVVGNPIRLDNGASANIVAPTALATRSDYSAGSPEFCISYVE